MTNQNSELQELRQAVLTELETPSKKYRGRGLFSKLKALRTSPQTREWLEASVAVGVLKRERPHNTLAHINALRDMVKTEQEKQQFEKLHEMVVKHLSPLHLTHHGYIEPEVLFKNVSHKEIWDGIESHMKALKDAGHKVFLNSGTLLGLVRDGKLIDHDNDIDLGIILDASDEDAVVAEWATFTQEVRDLGILCEERSEPHNGMLRLLPIMGYTCDIFPAWFAQNKVYVFPHTYGEIEPKDVYPFRTCNISGLDQPAVPEKMLAINYGPGWDKMDPLWKFVRPAGFNSFMKKLSTLENA